jgi:phage protein D
MPAETSVSQSAVYRARPTLRLAGQEDLRVSELLIGMRIEESEGGMSTAELRFSNWASTTDAGAEYAFEDGSRLALGTAIEVYAGDETQARELFRGVVSGFEAEFAQGSPPELVVLAEDPLGRARMARRSKVYSDMSPADVVNAVANELGLRPSVQGLAEPIATWAQLNESDLAFLRRLLGRFDADLQIVGEELQVAPRGEVRRGELSLELHGQLARARVVADLAQQVTSITAAGWDPVAGSPVSAEVGSLSHGGPGAGTSGGDWLARALERRSEHLGHLALATDAEARAVAEAAFDQRARRFVRLDGVAEGNAQLRVGSHVAVSGLSARWDNSYYVVEARHRYDVRAGYRTEFVAECAYLGEGS